MKRTWPTTVLAALLLWLGLRTFWHLPDIVPWGPPVLPAEALRISPTAATSILFSITGLYGVALLSAAYALFMCRPWAKTAYLLAAASFLANYGSIFAFVKNSISGTALVLVLAVLILPALYLGWWTVARQFRPASNAVG